MQLQRLNLKAKLFRGLSETSRLAILESLKDGRKSVGELVESTQLSQPNVSNHLACLRGCGLVEKHQVGRFIYYSLSNTSIAELMDMSDAVLSALSNSIDACSETFKGSELSVSTRENK